MVSGGRRTRFRSPGWLGLEVAGLLFSLVSCDGSGTPARSEPWLKDEVGLSRTEGQSVRYLAEPGQVLHFSVRTKQGDLRGTVPLQSAELDLDPRALDGGRGKLTFDLQRLSLERVTEEEGGGAAPAGDLLLTEAARLWLGLGPDVPRQAKLDGARAHFDVRLGRGLSSHSVQGGTPVPLLDAAGRRVGTARRVSGIVEGDLLLLGREVTHVLKVDVEFSTARGAPPGVPERVLVRLSEADGIPLSEHGIVPRDARGAVVSEQWAAFGRSPALRALVTGLLRFERSRE